MQLQITLSLYFKGRFGGASQRVGRFVTESGLPKAGHLHIALFDSRQLSRRRFPFAHGGREAFVNLPQFLVDLNGPAGGRVGVR